MLGVAREVEKRNFKAAKFGADRDYGVPLVDLKEGTTGTLFPPLISEV